jgi:hypothetical protein
MVLGRVEILLRIRSEYGDKFDVGSSSYQNDIQKEHKMPKMSNSRPIDTLCGRIA